MIRVYVAGPISGDDVARNVYSAWHMADTLIAKGYAPFCPHLFHFANTMAPRRYEDWLRLDFEWLRQCHAVLRLPGDSPGADRECALAEEEGIPVYHTLAALLADLPPEQRHTTRPSMPMLRVHQPQREGV